MLQVGDLVSQRRHAHVEVDLSLQTASGWRLWLTEKACACRGRLELAECFRMETCAWRLHFQNTSQIQDDLGLETRHVHVEVDLSLQNASGWRLGLTEKAHAQLNGPANCQSPHSDGNGTLFGDATLGQGFFGA